MTDLRAASEQDIRAELERRQREASIPEPVPVASPDFGPLIQTVTSGVQQMIQDGYADEDFPHYVYEAAMTAVYGEDYWLWRNTRSW